MINSIIEEMYSDGEVTDSKFLNAVYQIEKNYFIVRPRMNGSVKKFINNFNSVSEYHKIKFTSFENTPIGFSVEEMFLKALAFNPKNPLDFMADHAIFIPKTKVMRDYLDSIETMNILLGADDPKYSIESQVPTFTSVSKGRIIRKFQEWYSQISPISEFQTKKAPEEKNGKLWFTLDMYLNESGQKISYNSLVSDFPEYEEIFMTEIRDAFEKITNKQCPSITNGEVRRRKGYIDPSYVDYDIVFDSHIQDNSFAPARIAKLFKSSMGKTAKYVGQKGKECNCVSLSYGFWIDKDLYYDIALK
ncbi:hypothetical protein D3C81_1113890 [compost metagenome]